MMAPLTATGSPAAPLWIKICGLTSEAAVAAALEAGADAIGFVFAPSKRQVSAERAADLTRHLPGHARRVAVMRHPTQALLDEVLTVFSPDLLQTDAEDLSQLRIPHGVDVLPVVRNRAPQDMASARVLFEGAASGAGETADWSLAAQIASTRQLVLAGGLSALNVAAAIAAVRPFGVDVSSGVETAPGIKDPAKIHEFVRRARAAASGASR